MDANTPTRLVSWFILAATIASSAYATTKSFADRECRVSFRLPSGWSAARILPRNRKERERVLCEVALRPKDWARIAKASRWEAPDPPLLLTVYAEHTSLQDALGEEGFREDENGRGFGMDGGYGTFAPADNYSQSQWRGKAAYTFFRGFIRDEARLEPHQSRVFSGETANIVIKGPNGRVLSFQCEGGTPDERVDCDGPIRLITKTIRFSSRRARK